MQYIRGLVGLAILVGLAYLISRNKKAIDWPLVAIGVTLQLLAGFLILKVPFVEGVFNRVSSGFVTFLSFSQEGARFIFGDLTDVSSFGFIFGFQVLPTIIFFSSVSAGLYYLGVLQKVVYGIAWLMARTMRLSGAGEFVGGGQYFLGSNRSALAGTPLYCRYDLV